jgi:methionyl-tRNA formyltransferase
MFNSILFFGRKNDPYSKKIVLFLKKNSKKLKVNLLRNLKDKNKVNLKKYEKNSYDYIFVYRSYHILKKKLIEQAKFAAINFHTGTPNYRGIGCTNFAILNHEKLYGCTAHIINEKVDFGKILNVKRFKILKKDDLGSVLKKVYKIQYLQIMNLMKKLLQNRNSLKEFIKDSKKEKWSSRLYTRKDLNKLYEVDPKLNKEELRSIIKALYTKKYRPYFLKEKKKIYLKN